MTWPRSLEPGAEIPHAQKSSAVNAESGWRTAITITVSARHRTGRPGHRATAVAALSGAVPVSALRGAGSDSAFGTAASFPGRDNAYTRLTSSSESGPKRSAIVLAGRTSENDSDEARFARLLGRHGASASDNATDELESRTLAVYHLTS